MGKVIKYGIVSVAQEPFDENYTEKLVTEVNQLIAQGWEPLGGITFLPHDGLLYQPIVLRQQ